MKRFLSPLSIVAMVVLVGAGLTGVVRATTGGTMSCTAKDAFCFEPQILAQVDKIEAANVPKIATPAWLDTATTPATREVSYVVATKGSVNSDVREFSDTVSQTLNSPSGWSRLGVRFVQVDAGGEFTIWLSEASQVPSFSPSGCDAIVSCRVGDNVIINETRWQQGADAWNAAGGSLVDYRRMVINHETGHWLGHGHEYCSGAGQAAHVMQQQTLDMQGCTPNPWPLPSELYSTRLGIRS